MAQVVDVRGVAHIATPYAQVSRQIMSYLTEGAALDTEAPEAILTEASYGGFSVEGWYIPDGHDGYFGFRDVYVTIEDAKQLVDSGLAHFRGYADTFEEAMILMTTNALPHEGQVFAYGSWHVPMTYDEAYHYCQWFTSHDVAHGRVDIVRVDDDAFELVAFGEDSEGGRVGGDSDYVTVETGRLLVLAGVAGVMVTSYDSEDLDDEETFNRLREEQLWG